MNTLNYPTPQTLLDAATAELRHVHTVYSEPSFTHVNQDRHVHGPLKPGRPATATKPGTPDYRDQNLWQSMAWSFDNGGTAPSALEIATMANNGQSYEASPLRTQLRWILESVGANRPDVVVDAQTLLMRMMENLKVAKKCADVISACGKIGYENRRHPRFRWEDMKPGWGDVVYEASMQTCNHNMWGSRESFYQCLENQKPSVRLLRMSNSDHLFGYHVIKRSQEYGHTDFSDTSKVMSAGAYKVLVTDPKYIGPSMGDLVVADILKVSIPTDTMSAAFGYSSLSYP